MNPARTNVTLYRLAKLGVDHHYVRSFHRRKNSPEIWELRSLKRSMILGRAQHFGNSPRAIKVKVRVLLTRGVD